MLPDLQTHKNTISHTFVNNMSFVQLIIITVIIIIVIAIVIIIVIIIIIVNASIIH